MLDAQPHKPVFFMQSCRRWISTPWVAVGIRVMMGGMFVFVGFSELVLPHEKVVALKR